MVWGDDRDAEGVIPYGCGCGVLHWVAETERYRFVGCDVPDGPFVWRGLTNGRFVNRPYGNERGSVHGVSVDSPLRLVLNGFSESAPSAHERAIRKSPLRERAGKCARELILLLLFLFGGYYAITFCL